MLSKSVLALTLLAGFAGAIPTQAAVTSFSALGEFAAAVSSPGVDTFDELPLATELGTPLHGSAGGYAYTATAGPVSDFLTASDDNVDNWLSTNVATDSITFSAFSVPVTAIGGYFFATDINGNSTAAPSITLTLTDAGGSTTSRLLNPTKSGFAGFVDTQPLLSLRVAIGNVPGAWTTVNDLTLAVTSAVPEPSIGILAACGLAVVGWEVRRRRRSSAK